MRTTIGIATFLAVGAGAMGASALSSISLKGSDTLYDVTQDVLAACSGAAGLTYLGGGSGGGQNAMTAASPTQSVAPMSRFLNACTTGGVTTAEGLVVGLDGISIVANKASAGTGVECNGADPSGTTCSNTTSGLIFSGTIAGTSYTVTNWRDLLRIVYGGMTGATDSNLANRDCNSTVRRTVVANWHSLFQSGTCGDSANPCPAGLRHAFARDDVSGTTDTFISNLNLTSIGRVQSTDTGALSYQIVTTAPFCNSLASSGSPAVATPPTGLDLYTGDVQDFDPIRVTCQGNNNGSTAPGLVATEQVCGRDKTLGVVLPIVPTTKLSKAAAFPTTPCTNRTDFAHMSKNAVVINSSNVATLTLGSQCPNGDGPGFFRTGSDASCLVPLDSSGNMNCLAGQNVKPVLAQKTTAVNGIKPTDVDGRVFNLYAYDSTTKRLLTDDVGRDIIGAYFRIHTSRTMASDGGAGTAGCTSLDATDQIGCLVTASPCSIGFAGNSAASVTGAVALKIKGQDPSDACVQALSYPLSRKLYLNTEIGFENVTGQELELAKCFANSTLINPIIKSRGFTNIPSTYPNGTAPYCENISAKAATNCAGAATVAAGSATGPCSNNPAGIPTAATQCNNGTVEPGEECDNGASNGSAASGAACSVTCRNNN